MAQMTSNIQDTPSSTILTRPNIDFWNHVFLRTFLVKVTCAFRNMCFITSAGLYGYLDGGYFLYLQLLRKLLALLACFGTWLHRQDIFRFHLCIL